MHVLLFILFIVIFIGLSLLLTVVRGISSIFRSRKSDTTRHEATRKKTRMTFNRQDKSPKVFDKNEGEYVDFEEVD